MASSNRRLKSMEVGRLGRTFAYTPGSPRRRAAGPMRLDKTVGYAERLTNVGTLLDAITS